MGFRFLLGDVAFKPCHYYSVREQDMKRHLWQKHRMRIQTEFKYDEARGSNAQPEPHHD